MPDFADYQSAGPGRQPPADLMIRTATHSDADGIAALYAAREAVSADEANAWAQRALEQLGDSKCLVTAESSAQIVGYGRAERLDHESAPAGFYLSGIVVSPPFRRMGIGLTLTQARMDWIAERADAAFYFANASNSATIDLHHRFGLSEVLRAAEIAGVSFDGGVGILYRSRFEPAAT